MGTSHGTVNSQPTRNRKLIKNTEDSKVKARKAGAIEAILEVMKVHIDTAGVCRTGCCALRDITTNNGK